MRSGDRTERTVLRSSPPVAYAYGTKFPLRISIPFHGLRPRNAARSGAYGKPNERTNERRAGLVTNTLHNNFFIVDTFKLCGVHN